MSNERERIDLAAFDGHTPGPWSVAFVEQRHRKGSPVCREVCEKDGCVPIRIEHDSPNDPMVREYGTTELHVMLGDRVEDIVAADGSHVVCTGHDYDESGSIPVVANARLIAAAPTLLAEVRALREERDALRAALDQIAGATVYSNDAQIMPAAMSHMKLAEFAIFARGIALRALARPTNAHEPTPAPDQRAGTTEDA